MDLSTRAYSCLKRAGIYTLEEIIQNTREDMTKIRNLGRKHLEEIEYKLNELGFALKDETPRKMTGREKLFEKLNSCNNKELAEMIVGSAICPEIVNKKLCEEGFCIQCLTEDFEREYDKTK